MSEFSECRMREHLSPYLLGALTPSQTADLEHHVAGCAECQAELEWLRPVVEVLPGTVEQVDPPARLKRDLMARIKEEAAGAAEPAPEPEKFDPKAAGGPGSSWWRSLLPGAASALRQPVVAGLAVAILALGVVTGYLLWGETGEPGSGGSAITASGGQAPGPLGELTVSGADGTLHVTDLQGLPEGRVYQAWVQRGNRIEPTDSLFLPSGDGSATTAIEGLEGADAVMVTAEDEGGAEAPTMEPLLVIRL